MKPFNLFPYDSNVDFMRLRYVSIAIAALIMFVAIGAMATKGFNFALDFTGGTVTELKFAKPADVDDVRQRLAANGFEGAPHGPAIGVPIVVAPHGHNRA